MAKSRSFSVRARAMSALLAEFSATRHLFAFVDTDFKRDFRALWDCMKSAEMFYHGGQCNLQDASMTAFDANSPISAMTKRKLLVMYNRRRSRERAEVLTIFTCRGNILGFVVVSDNGRASWFAVESVEETDDLNAKDVTAFVKTLAAPLASHRW